MILVYVCSCVVKFLETVVTSFMLLSRDKDYDLKTKHAEKYKNLTDAEQVFANVE